MQGRDGKAGSAVVGYGLAILQAVLYSTLGIFGKLVYATGLNAQQSVILRFFFATVLLGIFMLIWKRQAFVSRQPSVYLQAVFFYISSIFYFFTVERLTAGMTTVIFYAYPAVVAVASLFVFKERLSVSTVVAFVLAISGLAMVSGVAAGEVTLDALGILFGIVSCVAFAAYTILIQKTGRSESPLTVTFTLSWTSLLASCIVFAPSLPGLLDLDAYQLMLGALMALFATILPIFIYIEAIKRIGGTKSSLIGISETPFSLIIAFLVLGETLTLGQGIGSCLIVASIAVITIAPLLAKDKKPR
ncbi:DMT family transporter [Adlercreutzia sp. ZJ242]|uniref:DMT family transporter n=1 Tax=Adlercreutzia sp. ZJ242 TaxID=2709409 RepID=UPI0013EC1D7A|nr:DMT family transporter [Adlercreutzia sp. ZJ242]